MKIKRLINSVFHNKIVLNTCILIISSLLIRMLSLVNRIILTRELGLNGISIYTIVMPSIMLFVSLGSLSLNIAMTKLTANDDNPKIIKKGIIIALASATCTTLLLLTVIKFLTSSLLKQPITFFPIIASIPLIYLTAISNVLRGYYNGLQKMKISSTANLLEQIVRISFTFFIFIIFDGETLIFLVTASIIAMSIGEVASIIYTSYLIPNTPTSKTKCTYKNILNIAIPTTLSSMISSITFFLEPIVFTFAYSLLKYNNYEILELYTITSAYTLPLLTMFSFIPSSIAISIMPNVASENQQKTTHYIKKGLLYSLLPSLIIAILINNYSFEFMQLIYGSSYGAREAKKYSYFFIIMYIIPTLTSIMQGINKAKLLFVVSTIVHIVKIGLIFILPFILKSSLITAYMITYYLYAIFLLVIIYKTLKIKLSVSIFINIGIIFIFNYFISKIIKAININYLIASILMVIIFIISSLMLFSKTVDND